MRTFEEWDREQTKRLNMRPVCKQCGEHIQDECYYLLPIIGAVCEACIEDFKKYIED